MRRDRVRTVALACLFTLLLVLLVHTVLAVPPPATEFYGNVTRRNDSQPYEVGTVVRAYDGTGVLCGEFTVVTAGKYGLMSCNGDDTNTTGDEGPLEGESVVFTVGSRNAAVINGSSVWSLGIFQRADLLDNNAPNITAIGDLNATEDIAFFQIVEAFDLDGDNLTFNATFLNSSAFFNFTWLTFNTSAINFTPTNADVGTHAVLITVTDQFEQDSELITFRVFNVNDPPYFVENLTDHNQTEDQPWHYDINATDEDLIWGDNLTYLDNTTYFDIHPDTGVINWTPSLEYPNMSINILVCDLQGMAEYRNGTFNQTTYVLLNGTYNTTIGNETNATNMTWLGWYNGTFSGIFNGTFNTTDNVSTDVFIGWFNGTYNGTYTNESNHTVEIQWEGVFNGTFYGLLPESCIEDSFNLSVIPVNDPPVLNVPVLYAEANVPYTYQVVATDEEGDALTYNSSFLTNITLFTITIGGSISFTANDSDVGTHQVNISVTDNNSWSSQIVYVVVYPERYCGDGLCISPESCATCPTDCGTCPPGSGTGTGGGTGGSSTGGTGGSGSGGSEGISGTGGIGEALFEELIYHFYCSPNWHCTDWDACLPSGTQYRTCVDLNNCGSLSNKPNGEQACEYVEAETCFDGVQNQDEEGIDCGGVCEACVIYTPEFRYAAIPYAERTVGACGDNICAPGEKCSCPRDCRAFPETWPWLGFLLSMGIILLAAIGVQGWFVYKLKHGEITPKEYRRRSRILHVIAGSLLFLVALVSSLTYFLAYCLINILKGLLISFFIIGILGMIGYLFWHYFYAFDEKRMLRRIDRASQSHAKKIRALIRLQGRHAVETEREFSATVKRMHEKNSRYLKLHPELLGIYNLLRELFSSHEHPDDIVSVSGEIIELIDELRQSDAYLESLELYTMMRSIDEKIVLIRDHFVPLFGSLVDIMHLKDNFLVLNPGELEKKE